MGGGKGGGGQTVTQSNPNPWSGAEPYLVQGLHNLQQIFQSGTSLPGSVTIGNTTFEGGLDVPDYYPGSTITSLSPWTQQALAMQAQRGLQGSPLTDAAQQQLTGTMRGDYLMADSNPYLGSAINAATAPVEAAVNSAFSSAGRYGSGSHVDELSRGIGDISSRMAYQNYGDERNRQQQGMMFAPQLAQQDYFDINQVGATGSAIDAYNQSLINSDIERHNYGQDADWQRVQQFLASINGAAPFGSTGTSRGPAPDMFQSMLGTGMGLAGLGSMLGLFGGGGGLGAAGALAGGLIGSDERIKENIEQIGMLNNGLNVYSYNYIGDPVPRIGLLAQEVAEVNPEAVGHIGGGILGVDYGKATEDA